MHVCAMSRRGPGTDPAETDLLVRASRLYYLEERGQAEIARLLRISRPGVSRLLKRARAARIVEIRVREGVGGEDWSGLERRLGVKELHVAPETGIEAVGRLGAQFLERTVRRGWPVGPPGRPTPSAVPRAREPPRPPPPALVPPGRGRGGTRAGLRRSGPGPRRPP